MNISDYSIGLFDSGVGGLSVWKEIIKILPFENIVYYADSNNCPYGSKSQNEVIEFSIGITDFLLRKKCKLIIVACNTATAAAIEYLRDHNTVIFVGMEPAVKPAALNTKTGTIGILATKGTFQGKLFKETSSKWAEGKKIMIQPGEGLVELVESGKSNTVEAEQLLRKYIQPMLDNHVDQIVLGCTHYPFYLKLIEKIVAGKVSIIDPAPAIAKRVDDLLKDRNIVNIQKTKPVYEFFVNGNKSVLQKLINKMYQGDFKITEL